MRYRAILFDMDGVLIESEYLMRASAIRALADYGVQAKHEDFLEFTGMGEDYINNEEHQTLAAKMAESAASATTGRRSVRSR